MDQVVPYCHQAHPGLALGLFRVILRLVNHRHLGGRRRLLLICPAGNGAADGKGNNYGQCHQNRDQHLPQFFLLFHIVTSQLPMGFSYSFRVLL